MEDSNQDLKKVLLEETAGTSKPVGTVEVGLTHQEVKAANNKKENFEQLEKLRKENEKLKRENEEEKELTRALQDNLRFYQKKNFEINVILFQLAFENFQRTSQNLTDDLAKKIATRFIEKRIEALSQIVKNNEENTRESLFLHFYELLQKMGVDSLGKEIQEQFCMLNKHYKDEKFAAFERVFLSDEKLGDKMKEQMDRTGVMIAEDPVVAGQVFLTFFIEYILSGENFKRDVCQTNAKVFLETRIRSLSESAERSGNDSDKLETYQVVNAMDFDQIPLKLLQQIGTLDTVVDIPGFEQLEAILVGNLKAIM